MVTKSPFQLLWPFLFLLLTGGQLSLQDKSINSTIESPGPILATTAANTRPSGPSSTSVRPTPVEPTVEPILTPARELLFKPETLDSRQLAEMDCHLRNIDFCYAGLLAASSRALPESDAELESRCDEMRVASSCLATYNQRCATDRVLAMLAPFAQLQSQSFRLSSRELPPELNASLELPAQATRLFLPSDPKSKTNPKIALADLMGLCEPAARGQPNNQLIRNRLFEIGKCVNGRIGQLRPCIDDLKVAVQIFYEPGRFLPLRPSCCAVSRFRKCAMDALDGICGLTALEELESTLNSGAGSILMTVQRVCKQSADPKSTYCLDILPPSGARAPERRGSRASKLARALDLIKFAPAAGF